MKILVASKNKLSPDESEIDIVTESKDRTSIAKLKEKRQYLVATIEKFTRELEVVDDLISKIYDEIK